MQTHTQNSHGSVAHEPDEIERETSLATGGIDALSRSEIEAQVTTAHRFPRSIKRSLARALEMATLDEETAESCYYRLERSGKDIEGPSIRLAEIFASSWGNLRHGSRVVEEGEKFITAEGRCLDLETNNGTSVEVVRRITNKKGQRFNDDMIQVTAAAAQKIAQRNAILSVIPRAYVDSVMAKAKAVAVGDAATLSSKREKWVVWLGKVGVGKERMLAKLGRAGVEDITLEDLEKLIGFATALKEGQTTPEALFPAIAVTPDPSASSGAPQGKADKTADHIAAMAGAAKKPGPKPAGAPDEEEIAAALAREAEEAKR